MKTLQSIKKGIDLLDSRRAELRDGENDGTFGDARADDDVANDEGAHQPARR